MKTTKIKNILVIICCCVFLLLVIGTGIGFVAHTRYEAKRKKKIEQLREEMALFEQDIEKRREERELADVHPYTDLFNERLEDLSKKFPPSEHEKLEHEKTMREFRAASKALQEELEAGKEILAERLEDD